MANIFATGHALIIGTGTDRFGQLSPRFQSTINDAEWIAEVLKNPNLSGYPEGNVRVLTGKDATRQRIVEELDILAKRISDTKDNEPKDTVVVFFSGHGLRDGEKTYLLPFGYKEGEDLNTNAIDGDLLFKELRAIDAYRILLLLNSCYAGGVMPYLDSLPSTPFTPRQMKKLLEGNGFAYLSASQASQKAITGHLPRLSSRRYSLFTLGLARGFSGKEKQGRTRLVTFSDLASSCIAYVSTKSKGKQTPCFDYKGDNFVVGLHHPGGAKGILLLGDDVEVDTDEDEDNETVANPHTSPIYQPALPSLVQGNRSAFSAYGPAISGSNVKGDFSVNRSRSVHNDNRRIVYENSNNGENYWYDSH